MKLPILLQNRTFKKFLGPILYRYARAGEGPLFVDLLTQRRDVMWRRDFPGMHSADECEHKLMDKECSLADWKCCGMWQRKLSNKINAKFFVEKIGINTAKLLWYGKDPKEIPFHDLPTTFAIKSSEGWCSEQVMLVKNNIDLLTRKAVSSQDIVDFFSVIHSLKNFKNAYVLIEELLTGTDTEVIPVDYKFWCFNGEAKFIQVVHRLKLTQTWYTRDWDPVSDHIHLKLPLGNFTLPPKDIALLIKAADNLAQAYDYKFVRIDLYDTDKGVYFGEFTHTPCVGNTRLLYTPYANKTFGTLWQTL